MAKFNQNSSNYAKLHHNTRDTDSVGIRSRKVSPAVRSYQTIITQRHESHPVRGTAHSLHAALYLRIMPTAGAEPATPRNLVRHQEPQGTERNEPSKNRLNIHYDESN